MLTDIREAEDEEKGVKEVVLGLPPPVDTLLWRKRRAGADWLSRLSDEQRRIVSDAIPEISDVIADRRDFLVSLPIITQAFVY